MLLVTTTTPTITEQIQIIERSVPQVNVEPTETDKVINKIIDVFGKDSEVMLKIAKCESGLKQHDDNGNVLVSSTSDTGAFQINQVHNENLNKLKLDPRKLDDNVRYAKMLFDASGTRDWYKSKGCWSKL